MDEISVDMSRQTFSESISQHDSPDRKVRNLICKSKGMPFTELASEEKAAARNFLNELEYPQESPVGIAREVLSELDTPQPREES